VYHFHDWCANAARKFKLNVSREGLYFDNCFDALENAVNSGAVTDSGYDAVLVDEGHDFDQRWLSLIARLFDNTTRSLLLMYDDAQSLYRRERALNFSLASVGIQAQGRTSVLRVNYRNPCRILNFAYAFSRDYFESHHNKELPLVLPEACGEEGDIPDIELCQSEAEEARRVVAWLKEQHAIACRWGDMAVVCPTRYSADRLTVLTFQSSKGLEFPYVAVINASFVHKAAADESEAIPALYVAFTRATRSLLVTCYKENSISRQLTKFAGVDLLGQPDDYA
jgi:superfamily I DNA/RNA helicase